MKICLSSVCVSITLASFLNAASDPILLAESSTPPQANTTGTQSSTTSDSKKQSEESADGKSTKYLDKVVTVATGFDLPIRDESRNVMVIDKESLQNKGYLNLNQALQYAPFVTSSDSGFGNNIDIRGQGADANRAVKILINRVPISLLDTSHGVPPFNNVDIDDIERIEIIPGGGSVVYGSGTRGGVVNIVTKMPTKDITRIILKAMSGEKAGLQGGSLSGVLGRKITPNLYLRGDVSVGYAPGARNTAGIASDRSAISAFSNDNSTNIYSAFQAVFTPSEGEKFDFNLSYSHMWRNLPKSYLSLTSTSRSSGSGSSAGSGSGSSGQSTRKPYATLLSERNDPDEYTVKTQSDAVQTSLNYTNKIRQNLDLDALAFYQVSLLRYTQDSRCLSGKRSESNCSAGVMTMAPSGFANHSAGLNLKARHSLDKNTLMLGLDNILEFSNRTNYVDHQFPNNSSGSSGSGGSGSSGGQTNSNYTYTSSNTAIKLSNSLYAFDIYSLSKEFSISGGGRLEYSNYWVGNTQKYNSQNLDFNAHTSRLGYALEITPNYNYSDTGNVYAKAELGFISPSAYQMINADPNSDINKNNSSSTGGSSGSSGGSSSQTTLNKNEFNGIKPEQYLNAEVGLKDQLDFSFISASAFYTHSFNEIYVNSVSHGFSYTYGNLGQTQRAGLEVSASQSLLESILRLSESVGFIYSNVLETYLANDYLKGNLVPYVPWLKATLNIESDVIKTQSFALTVFMNNAYVSQSVDTPESSSSGSSSGSSSTVKTSHLMNKGGYLLSDIGAIISLAKIYTLNVGVRNVFNSYYVTYQKYPNIIPAMGRTYYAELRVTF